MYAALMARASAAALCVILAACATVNLDEDLSDYGDEVSRLTRSLESSPDDVETLARLGEIYVRTGYPEDARGHLERAWNLGARDAKTSFYLGLAHESVGNAKFAIAIYGTYPDVSRSSPYRKLMEGRYTILVREAAYEEMSARLAAEDSIAAIEPAEDVIAVLSWTYAGGDERYAPLGRGLAEMLTIDLQNVEELRVVERVRLQALLDELALGQTGVVEAGTAPRMGRLLGVGRLVGGTYSVLQESDLRFDPALFKTATAVREDLSSHTDAISNFFALEKRVVFELIDDLGIELSEAEQQRIQEIPTRNLQAFLAFSRGLQEEDRGAFDAASGFFEQAASLDPGFSEAAAKQEGAVGASEAGGSVGSVLTTAKQVEPFAGGEIDLVDSRIDRLGSGVGSPQVPGPDARKPAVEAVVAERRLPGLPDPPQPPGGK